MGRRRRKVIKAPRRTLPKVFTCMVCGRKAVVVKMQREEGCAVVHCGACNRHDRIEAAPGIAPVDVYSLWCDSFYKVKAVV
ncbi:MAG: hypothetical protein QW057_00280 [Candidatus Bathyarchaeia archaeon]